MNVEEKFKENLEMAKEDFPHQSYEQHLRRAVTFTEQDVVYFLGQLNERYWAAHLERVNKHNGE